MVKGIRASYASAVSAQQGGAHRGADPFFELVVVVAPVPDELVVRVGAGDDPGGIGGGLAAGLIPLGTGMGLAMTPATSGTRPRPRCRSD